MLVCFVVFLSDWFSFLYLPVNTPSRRRPPLITEDHKENTPSDIAMLFIFRNLF